jgi:uncharacterized membrane protein
MVMGFSAVIAELVANLGGRDVAAIFRAMGMAVGMGLATCVFLRLSLAWPLIIDGQRGILTSLSMSWRYTRGNFFSMLAAIVVAAVLGTIAFALTCGIGSIVVMPFMTLGWVVAYLLMTGQLGIEEERF